MNKKYLSQDWYLYVKWLDKENPLETNPTKKSWQLKKVRHKIKEVLNELLKDK